MAQEPYEWTITWSANNAGVVECPGEFMAADVYFCLPGGNDMLPRYSQGRACAMGKAILNAKSGFCQPAFAITLATQCHNPAEQEVLRKAGVTKVCDYLKRF